MARRKAATADPFPTLTNAEYRALEAKRTTEEDFRRALRRHAKGCGWKTYHTKFSIGSDPGFPDEVFLRDGRCVVVECKRVGLVPTAVQQDWLDAFAAVPGVAAYHWTPADWDEIYAVLA